VKEHAVPAQHILEEYLDAGGLRAEPEGPLFRSLALAPRAAVV
jgi:hypothetical protein